MLYIDKPDTSPYAYCGEQICPEYFVEQFNEHEVDEFINDADFLFGNKRKRAERKLQRAEKKLAKGKTRPAARLQRKATKILSRIGEGQKQQLEAVRQLGEVTEGQKQLKQEYELASRSGEVTAPAPAGLSEQPLTEVASSAAPGGGSMPVMEASPLPGVESPASDDEPTGKLAEVKELGGVTVKAKRKDNTLLFIIAGIALAAALLYFMKLKK